MITAVRGRRDIHFFNRRGKRLRRKRDLSGGPTPPFDSVIIDHAISPDGRRLASTLWITMANSDPRPGRAAGHGLQHERLVLTRVGRPAAAGHHGLRSERHLVTNSRPIVIAPYVFHTADAFIVDLANPNSPAQWFQDRATVDVLDPSDGEPPNDGELTRAQDKIAVVRGPSTTASATPTMIRVYAVSSLAARPTERCDLRSAPSTRIESPSWSPDGKQLAWGEPDGIWVSPIAGGAGACGEAPRRLIAGGSQPDWGPANVR